MSRFKNPEIILKDSYTTTVSEVMIVKPILDKEGKIKYWGEVKDKSTYQKK